MSCTLGNSYIVKSGDTLFIIAQQQLDDGERWHEILKPDGMPFTDGDASNLQVGQEICIPGSTPLPPPSGKQINLEARFYSMEETNCHLPASGVHGVTLQAALALQLQSQCQGESVGRLQCAVDPNVIPLLTNFTLVLWDGRQVPAAALDIGTAIIGQKIDIFVDSVEEAINLGVQSVTAIL
ncbi:MULTISPECIES: 3D domain-containing protein [unclassified Nostoc]|uniref:3D domain-containing protein n=1 Tax=unclassified Nostoc TaxID=2593658 RepID=UPI002B219BDD|nr:3D domain-containing protein [Nostoc sp. UHCC 0251]MEA5628235.1 3D domain-containing protein [Nostoc sp. UHCC 0251]